MKTVFVGAILAALAGCATAPAPVETGETTASRVPESASGAPPRRREPCGGGPIILEDEDAQAPTAQPK